MLKTLFTLLALIPLYVTAEYKNTNGKAIDKSIKDLIRWQRNQKKPVLASIEISDEWKSIDFEEEVFSQNEEGISETNLSKRSLKVFEKVYMDLHVDEMEFSNEDFKNIYFNIIECFNENKEISIDKFMNKLSENYQNVYDNKPNKNKI